MTNENIKMLINNLIKKLEKECIKKNYPTLRGDEGGTKVFVLKLEERLISNYGKKRENIICKKIAIRLLNFCVI